MKKLFKVYYEYSNEILTIYITGTISDQEWRQLLQIKDPCI